MGAMESGIQAQGARRLFAGVAVAATAPLRELVAGLRRELAGERIRWTRLENLHLTVEFFGAVAEARIPELTRALAAAAGAAAPFTLELAGLGTFGRPRQPRVLWLGVESAGLRELHGAVGAALRAAGWPPEARAFAPHLTLGRLERRKDPRRFGEIVARAGGAPAGEQAVAELILFESVNGRYVPLGKWELGEGIFNIQSFNIQ
jgi:RNA 2',3'-cyclic 3'-phosphodiesterase